MIRHDAESVSRREFIKTSTAGAAATAGLLHVHAEGRAEAHEETAHQRLRVGVVGCGAWGQVHLNTLLRLQAEGRVEVATVCDVFNKYRDKAAERVRRADRSAARRTPRSSGDFRDLVDDPSLDVLLVAAPNHWHAAMTAAALNAGKHVYCETPLTHSLAEEDAVLAAWRESGRVLQVGVQRLSDRRFRAANEFLRAGGIGQVVHAQTECFRNSASGQWRSAGLSREMTPANIDWRMFLGSEFGLAEEMPFDRAKFAQWRCYWPFSQGPFSELFAPRITQMIAALGVRYPHRVAAGGGIFLERDGRDVPDTATLVADYDEGLQLLVTATLCNDHGIEHCIRGRHGTIVFDSSRDGFDVLPQRPQSSAEPMPRKLHIAAPRPKDELYAHWVDFLNAVEAGDPAGCSCPPDLAAAAATTAQLAAESYRGGKVIAWRDGQSMASGREFAQRWEASSRQTHSPTPADPRRSDAPKPPAYQKLAGPWSDDHTDPAVFS